MKKIILLLLIILILGGCYDYVEINDLAFISSIGIDYHNDEFELTMEILNDQKQSDDKQEKLSATVSSSGKSIAKAFDNISLKIDKNAYYHHLKAVVISKEVAKNHLEEIVDYFVRNPHIRKEFYLTIASNDDAKNFINSNSKTIPVIGNEIAKEIETGNYNAAYNKSFEDILEKLLNNKVESIATSLSLDNNKITINGIALFKGYKYIETLSADDSAIFNILTNNETNYLITKYYNELPFSVKVYASKVSYSFKEKEIKVNIKLTAEIIENAPKKNLNSENIYKGINIDFSKEIKKNFIHLLDELKNQNIDAIGLNNMQYKKSKKNRKDILKECDFDVSVDLVIDRKGLIFEVK